MKMIDKETMIIKSNAPLYSASPAWRTTDQARIVPKSPNSFKKITALSFTVRHAILPIRQRASRLSSLDGGRLLLQNSLNGLNGLNGSFYAIISINASILVFTLGSVEVEYSSSR